MARVHVVTKTGKVFKPDLEKMGNNPAAVDSNFAAYWRDFAVHGENKSVSFPLLRGGHISIRTNNVDYVIVED